MLAAGKLRHRLKIKRRKTDIDGDPLVDDAGQPLDEWIDYITVWADMRAPTGLGLISGEFNAADQQVSRVQYSARIRFRTDITASMRAENNRGVIFDIKQVIPDENGREYTDLVLTTGASNG